MLLLTDAVIHDGKPVRDQGAPLVETATVAEPASYPTFCMVLSIMTVGGASSWRSVKVELTVPAVIVTKASLSW